eukprot:GILK01009405.1.p1 GENE.GILK01009405.1~~GILK01009405.1.p1  ORF type:complete len:193 (+),score=33.43 GILK01009405.1:40-579(+)
MEEGLATNGSSQDSQVVEKEKYVSLKRRFICLQEEHHKLLSAHQNSRKQLAQLKRKKKFLIQKLESVLRTDRKLSDESETETEASEEEVEVEKPVKKKKEVDPLAPKRPPNPFMIYCRENRARVREANSDAPMSELTKLLSDEWNRLPPEDKKVYADLHGAEKERYQSEMHDYLSTQQK